MTNIRLTTVGAGYLTKFAATPIHVYRTPDKPGSGVSRPALDRLLRDGLVELSEYVPLYGQRVIVTDLGRQLLAQDQEQR